jgi:multiple sugar transport system substrate-binding protein
MFKKIILLIMVVFFLYAGMAWAQETIVFWAMPNAPDDSHLSWLEKTAADFKTNTGITVNYEIVGWGDAWSKISMSLIEPICDVSQVGTTWNPQFAATGGLEQVDINEFGGADSFMLANLESTTYKDNYYGIPWFAETRCLFYNKDMFKEAGAVPPTTWDELVMAGEKINAKYGAGRAFAMAGTNAWDLLHNWAILLWQSGGNLLSADNKKATFNSDAGIKAMQWYVDLVRKGLADKACAEYNQPQADSAFINGNVAMCYMGPWNIANIEDENPTLNYGIVEPPKGSVGKGSFSGGSNLVVFANSKHKEAAKAWVNYLIEKQALVDYTKNLTHMLPAKNEAFEDPYYNTGVWKVFKETLSYATAYPPLGVWGDIENAVVSEFKNVLSAYIDGKYTEGTAQEYLDQAAMAVDRALAKEK